MKMDKRKSGMKKLKLPIAKSGVAGVPVNIVDSQTMADLAGSFSPAQQAWIKATGFNAKNGEVCILPDEKGGLSRLLFAHAQDANPLETGKLSTALPAGTYQFSGKPEPQYLAILGVMLGSYRFDRYVERPDRKVSFVLPKSTDRVKLIRECEATFLVRDLINTPTNDMGPDQLEMAFRQLATRYRAKVEVTSGNELLKKNFPMIHAVGRASSQPPRLLDMKWGNSRHPKLTLVGKGVCFDTGGLNIKPGSSMALMKKDMGGAANVMGLAMMIMEAKLPVRLRVLIPAVENSISANAFRPGDILPSRKGISVEIGNTDAEGRLVLGDALCLGDEESPDLMIDMATLTGAARVALGPDLPPFYTDDEDIAAALATASEETRDPLWRMPLWKPYISMLSSNIADTNHITSGGFAGSVTAALFLQKFVRRETPWIHLDVFGWVPTARAWAPLGGEAQGIRALYAVLEMRYPKS
jgi:leucyl aminopeptidase